MTDTDSYKVLDAAVRAHVAQECVGGFAAEWVLVSAVADADPDLSSFHVAVSKTAAHGHLGLLASADTALRAAISKGGDS